MGTEGLNSFMLISLGAGFFAISFNKGRAGELRSSIAFAVLAAVVGLTKAADDGVYNREPGAIFAIVCGYVLLPMLGVMVSRRLFEASRGRKDKSNGSTGLK